VNVIVNRKKIDLMALYLTKLLETRLENSNKLRKRTMRDFLALSLVLFLDFSFWRQKSGNFHLLSLNGANNFPAFFLSVRCKWKAKTTSNNERLAPQIDFYFYE
jgi:hypothetical protein